MNDFFYGWYLKCQSATQTLAVIPAVHQTEGKRTCSIPFLVKVRYHGTVFVCAVSGVSPQCSEHASSGLRNSEDQWTDICISRRVGILGGRPGTLISEGIYLDAVCCFSGGSLMLSVADIPIAGFHFRGIISVVLWHGREYRIATYLGARVVRIGNGTVRVIQGDLQLDAKMLEMTKRPLMAPKKGNMVRTIHESVASRARYRFRKGGRTVFAFETDRASFEYEYPL